MTVTFLSTSGDAIHTVECIGSPIYSLKCSCGGYKDIQSCKHVNAVLEANPFLDDPTPAEGFAEACEAIMGSPVKQAYGDLWKHLGRIELERTRLKEEERSAKKEFYRKLAMGIASVFLFLILTSTSAIAQKVESGWDRMISVQKVERDALHNRQESEIKLLAQLQEAHLKIASGDERKEAAREYIVEREKLLSRHAAERSEMLKLHSQERADHRQRSEGRIAQRSGVPD